MGIPGVFRLGRHQNVFLSFYLRKTGQTKACPEGISRLSAQKLSAGKATVSQRPEHRTVDRKAVGMDIGRRHCMALTRKDRPEIHIF